jgi:hypothetical protein
MPLLFAFLFYMPCIVKTLLKVELEKTISLKTAPVLLCNASSCLAQTGTHASPTGIFYSKILL